MSWIASRQFFIRYRYNVANDFPLRQGKQPRFLMVSGLADFRRFTSNMLWPMAWCMCRKRTPGKLLLTAYLGILGSRVHDRPAATKFVPFDYAETSLRERARVNKTSGRSGVRSGDGWSAVCGMMRRSLERLDVQGVVRRLSGYV